MDSYGQQLVTEHHEIVRAIRSGNAQAARERAAEHVTKTVGRSSNVDVRSVSIQPGVLPTGNNMEWLFESGRTRTQALASPTKAAYQKIGPTRALQVFREMLLPWLCPAPPL